MRCLLSGNDFCGGPEAIGCQAHQGVRLSTHNIVLLFTTERQLPQKLE